MSNRWRERLEQFRDALNGYLPREVIDRIAPIVAEIAYDQATYEQIAAAMVEIGREATALMEMERTPENIKEWGTRFGILLGIATEIVEQIDVSALPPEAFGWIQSQRQAIQAHQDGVRQKARAIMEQYRDRTIAETAHQWRTL